MSHSGWSSTQRITLGATVPTAVPLTIHARALNTTLSGIQAAVSVSDGSSANYFALRTSNASAQASTTAASSGSQASGATSLSTSTWYSLCARFSAINSRQIFVDGTQDGTSSGSRTPTGINTGRIATLGGTGNAWVGSLAEVAVWNVALSDADIAALAHVSPLLIRPDALISYIPLLDSGSLDLVAPAATVTGSITKDDDHPRVILPRQRSLIIPKSAGGGGVNEELSGTAINGAATVAGALNARFALSGTAVTGSATVAGALTRSRNLAGSATGTATATGDLVVQYALTGDITGSATVSGELEGGSGPPVAPTQIGPADDRPTRRKRRDRETLEAYYAALQRKANEDAEREKLEALAEAERALEEAETAKKAEAKRAAVRKVFAALDRAALTEKAKAGAREAEQAALEAITKRQTQEQRQAYLDALDQLNVEIEFIGAQIARLYARRREEEQFLLQRWFAA